MQPQRIVEDPRERARTETEFEIYKNTQRELLRSRFVLNAALRRPDAVRTKLAQDEKTDAISELRDELNVYFPGDAEIMQVSMTDYDANEVNTLVNAVVQEYMDEIVDKERNASRKRLSQLESICNTKLIELRSKRTAIKQLATRLGTGDTEALTLKQQIALETFSQFRQELTKGQLSVDAGGGRPEDPTRHDGQRRGDGSLRVRTRHGR